MVNILKICKLTDEEMAKFRQLPKSCTELKGRFLLGGICGLEAILVDLQQSNLRLQGRSRDAQLGSRA